MTYGQVRDASLKLLHQYSLGDEVIARSYNDQGDYLRRIPELVDDAMWIIAAGPRRIRASKTLRRDRAGDREGFCCFRLPEDLMDAATDGLRLYGLDLCRVTEYLQPDDRHILIPACFDTIWLQYYRRPVSCLADLPEGRTEPCDCAALDNTPDTHRAIPYYVAAHLVLQDDENVYLTLMAEWRDLLRRLALPPRAHSRVTEDVYDWEAAE